jgi:hypothetical protein
MTKGELKGKLNIPTRMARPKGDMFQNLRRPEQVESISIEELVAPPAPAETPTPVVTPATTPVNTPVDTPAPTPASSSIESSDRQPLQYLDATHTASEAQVYSVMYRETVSKNMRERHFGPTELMKKTGIRSDRTIRRAIDGLLAKLSIEITAYAEGSPLGPRYRVHKPKDIEQRRKAAGLEIDQFTKRITTPVGTPVTTPVATGDKNYRGTGVANTPVTGVEIAGVYKYLNDHLGTQPTTGGSSSNDPRADDEAFAKSLREVERELTGKASPAEAWDQFFDLIVTELRIASARADSISSVPAFLTEHLRRRLFKRSRDEMEGQGRAALETPATQPVDASKCPDCGSTGWWYPHGPEKGVARCAHTKLTVPAPESK